MYTCSVRLFAIKVMKLQGLRCITSDNFCDGYNLVIVVLARKLTGVIYHLLVTCEEYVEGG